MCTEWCEDVKLASDVVTRGVQLVHTHLGQPVYVEVEDGFHSEWHFKLSKLKATEILACYLGLEQSFFGTVSIMEGCDKIASSLSLKRKVLNTMSEETVKREYSPHGETVRGNGFQRAQKRVRVICTDPDATDSSSDEEDTIRMVRNSQRRLVREIHLSSETFAAEESSSDSDLDEPEVPSYHTVFTAEAMHCPVSYARQIDNEAVFESSIFMRNRGNQKG